RTPHARACAPPGASSAARSCLPPGVDHVDLPVTSRRAAVAHRVRLRRLSLAVVERTSQLVAASAAYHVHGIPELRCTHLVGHVLQHAYDSAVPNLIEQLAAELRVVPLLVDRERT